MAEDKKLPPYSKDDLQHLKLAREFENLHLHPGWKLYISILDGHLREKELEAMQIAGSVDEALKQNAAKGAVLMGRLARDITSGIIRVAQEIRKSKSGEEL